MADIYGTLAGATAYHADWDNSAWVATGVTDAKRNAALVRAAAALDGHYGGQFPGRKTGVRVQALAWPRTGARDH
jgi:hypothetical protein|nr:DnaT-like ssDNA-binding protein [Hoeflea sp. 108]